MSTTTAAYGSWRSPIDAESVARGEVLPEWVGFVGDEVWWTEPRPNESGRSALVRFVDGAVVDALPGWDVRCTVIGYGGRPWLGLPDGGVVFSHLPDQRVYRWLPGAEPIPLTPAGHAGQSLRYADFSVRAGEVWCLRETVHDVAETTVERHLVAVPLDGRAADQPDEVRVLAATHHFLTGPRVSRDGRRAAWLGWEHPSMPWDSTDLMVADIDDGGMLGPARRVAGGPGVSVAQAEWALRSDTLHLLADPDGWWNVYDLDRAGTLTARRPAPEEFGDGLWRIGLRWLLPLDDGSLAVVHGTNLRSLGVLTPDGALRDVDTPYTEWTHPATDGRRIAAVAASPSHGRTVVLVDPDKGVEVLRPPASEQAEYCSTPHHRIYCGPDGDQVHAHVYPPHSPDHVGPAGDLPPYLVLAHGGPTSRSHLIRNREISYFTSRGIGVVDVQYGGSTGFGRAYRERLRHAWGVVDVRDCATAARGVVADGLADPGRLAIRGGSAGGWTAAASLIAEPSLYRAAAIYYPVLDLEGWRTRGTHDFESRYLDGLVGLWPAARETYRARSPVHHADHIGAPFVLFQGLDDTVCPPAQAERLLAELDDFPAQRYLTFAGEGHGFRHADTIVACLRAELELYTTVLCARTTGEPAAATDRRPADAREEDTCL